jgi:ribosomal protein S18 acetylase RimI-like enzyme
LRPAGPEDAEFLYQVYAHTRYEELSRVPWTTEQVEQFLRMQFHAQDIHYRAHYPNTTYDIVQVNGEAAGRLYICRKPGHLIIMDITMLPAYRGKGIGTYLLQNVLHEATEAQQRVTIHVEKENPARLLYQRLGFKPVADVGIYEELAWVSTQ